MSSLTVVLPDNSTALLYIADLQLVFDGIRFVEPSDAKWVTLISVPVHALTKPFADIPSALIYTDAFVRAAVVGYDALAYPIEDAVTEPDPSLGNCICFITCTGIDLRYVQVQPT